jgi:hypothetical protein
MPHIGKNIWIEVVKRKILKELEKNKNIVITDVRFPNELELIKTFGGIIIRVTRDSVNTQLDVHESEKLIETLQVDYDIQNNGTIEELYKKISELVVS